MKDQEKGQKRERGVALIDKQIYKGINTTTKEREQRGEGQRL